MLTVLIHLFIFWLIADITAAVISKLRKKKPKENYSGAAALAVTVTYLTIGWYMAHHVSMTKYTFKTYKELGNSSIRIAMIADSHLGVTLDGKEFAEQMKRINKKEAPDVLIIAGDFVDDYSKKSDMITACDALGKMETKYGIYFSFGNHDKGYFENRDFTETELRDELKKNNVIILEDESVMLNENICLIGRQDKSIEERADFADIEKGDISAYQIVIDHQPNAYTEEAEGGADLVLSGHTHGGHIFPTGYIGLLIGANDFLYGTEHRSYLGNNTDFVVTSGISGWAIPFKTGTKSEYVIIDIIN